MIQTAPKINIPFVSEDPDSFQPSYAHAGDAALDLHASCAGSIEPGHRKLIPCGFSMAIPEGYAGLVLPRSGLAAHHGVTVLNAPGLIDSSYRGEIMVALLNTDIEKPFEFSIGDRIAQLMIVQYPYVSLQHVDALEDTVRGSGGFGSSGVS